MSVVMRGRRRGCMQASVVFSIGRLVGCVRAGPPERGACSNHSVTVQGAVC